MAGAAVKRQMFADIPSLIFRLRHRPRRHRGSCEQMLHATKAEVCLPCRQSIAVQRPGAANRPLRPPFPGTRRNLWLITPPQKVRFGPIGRDLARIGSSPSGEGLPYEEIGLSEIFVSEFCFTRSAPWRRPHILSTPHD